MQSQNLWKNQPQAGYGFFFEPKRMSKCFIFQNLVKGYWAITLNLMLILYVELTYPLLVIRSLISHSRMSSGFFNRLSSFTSRYWLMTSKSHWAVISSGSVGMNPDASTESLSSILPLPAKTKRVHQIMQSFPGISRDKVWICHMTWFIP